jgi:hypothetical protein
MSTEHQSLVSNHNNISKDVETRSFIMNRFQYSVPGKRRYGIVLVYSVHSFTKTLPFACLHLEI